MNGLPVITAPTAQTVGVGKAAAITGVSLTESGNTRRRDVHGDGGRQQRLLSATAGAAIVTNDGEQRPDDQRLAGRGQHRAGHAERHRRHGGSDTITVNASDSFGNARDADDRGVTVNGLPVITAPTAETVGVGKAASIPGVSLSESGNTAGETFTVTVADSNGLLSATAGAAIVTNNGSKDADDRGSLGAVEHRPGAR